MRFLLGISLCVLVLVSCEATKKKKMNPSTEDYQWRLETWTDNDTNLSSKAWLKLNKETKKFSAYSGCNYINGTYTIDTDELNLLIRMQTYKACANKRFEEEFIRTLRRANNYKKENGKLILLEDNTVLGRFR